jgi:hypothetical protein
MYVKIHRMPSDTMLAACDKELLGQSFSGDGRKITVVETFYGGEVVDAPTLAERMKSASILNLVGERVIAVAIAEGMVSEENVIVIGGVKHAQAVVL